MASRDIGTWRPEAGETRAPAEGAGGLVVGAEDTAAGPHDDGPGEAPAPDLTARYEAGAVIGVGGTAEVRAAFDHRLRREVALKLMSRESAGARDRFVAESQVTAQLEHPNIVPVHDLGTTAEGRVFLAMKRVKGESLAELLARDPPPLARRLAIFRRVCDAIAFAHAQGVLHRDLKADNVMVGAFGEVLVMDWGLARPISGADEVVHVDRFEQSAFRTRHGQIAGTPVYMAPEQAEGRLDALDVRTDVYGLGAMLWEILVGRPPLEGPVDAVLAAVVRGDIRPPRAVRPDVPRELDAVVRKAMARQPAHRYASVRALAEDVDAWLERRPLVGVQSSLGERLSKWSARNRGAVRVGVAGGVLGLIVLLGGAARYAADVGAARDAAVYESERARAAELAARVELTRSNLAFSDVLASRGQLVEAARRLADAEGASPDDPLLQREIALARSQRAAESVLPVAVCKPHGDASVRALALSADGTRAASWGSDGRLVEWDTESCAVERATELAAAGGAGAGAVRLTPDGLEAAIVVTGANARLLVQRGGDTLELELPAAPIRAVGLDDGAWVTAGDGETWRVIEDVLVRDPWTPPDQALWQPDDGRRVATSNRTGGELGGVWSAAGEALWTGSSVTGADLDGDLLLVGSAESSWLVDLRTGARRWEIAGDPVARAGIAPGGRIGWLARFDGVLTLVSLEDGATQGTLVGGGAAVVTVTPDARVIALSGGDGAVTIYLRPRPDARHPLAPGPDDPPTATHGLAVDPTSTLAAVGSEDGTLTLLDLATGVVIDTRKVSESGVRQVAFSADGTRLAAALRNDGVGVLDLRTGTWSVLSTLTRTVAVAWDGDTLFAGDTEGWLGVADGGAVRRVRRVMGGPIWDLTPLGGGHFLAGGHIGGEHDIVVFDHDGVEVDRFANGDAVYHHDATRSGELVAWGGQNGDLRILDRSTRALRTLHADSGPTLGVAFSPDGSLLATTGYSRAVKLWDVASGRLLRTVADHLAPGINVTFTPDGSEVVSAGLDGVRRLPLAAHTAHAAAMRWRTNPAERARAFAAFGWWERMAEDAPLPLRVRARLATGDRAGARALAVGADSDDPLVWVLGWE